MKKIIGIGLFTFYGLVGMIGIIPSMLLGKEPDFLNFVNKHFDEICDKYLDDEEDTIS